MSFDANLQPMARLLLEVAINLQPGQDLLLEAPVHALPLARTIVKQAYEMGAGLVATVFLDGELDRSALELGGERSYAHFPPWTIAQHMGIFESGGASLFIVGDDPDLLAGIDPSKISKRNRHKMQTNKAIFDWMEKNENQWALAAYPQEKWARKVFPDQNPAKAMELLGDAILQAVRMDTPDPVQAWKEHVKASGARKEFLNRTRFDTLYYSGPGTDLKVGLPEGHIWMGVESITKSGVQFIPNMPTEELFTLPHREKVEGTVRSTRPLSYSGNRIDDFTLEFQKGRIVRVSAKTNEAILKDLVDTDEGSHFLGEVALVSEDSPLAQMHLLFHETLFDENASCHFALGRAYSQCLEGWEKLDAQGFQRAGGNQSIVHVDFMVGSDQLNVEGKTTSGERMVLLEKGRWRV